MKSFESWKKIKHNSFWGSIVAGLITSAISGIGITLVWKLPEWMVNLVYPSDINTGPLIWTFRVLFAILLVVVFAIIIYKYDKSIEKLLGEHDFIKVDPIIRGPLDEFLRECCDFSTPEVKPILIKFAKHSTADLMTAGSGQDRNGKCVALWEYVELLKMSIESQNLEEVTIIARVKPSSWGIRTSSELVELQKSAWAYFDQQKEAIRKGVKIQRIIIIPKHIYDNDDDYLKNNFISEHKKAGIQLAYIPNDQLTNNSQKQLSDMAEFVTKTDSKTSQKRWIVSTPELNENTVISDETPIRVHLIVDEKTINNRLHTLREEINYKLKDKNHEVWLTKEVDYNIKM